MCGVKLDKPLKEMEDAGIIPVFVKLLDHERREIHSQVILCMEMLMVSDIAKRPTRKEKAIFAGIIPHLLKVVDERKLLKQVALRILCDLPIQVLLLTQQYPLCFSPSASPQNSSKFSVKIRFIAAVFLYRFPPCVRSSGSIKWSIFTSKL